MIIISKTADLQKRLAVIRKSGKKIGFVPTMGALHQGHLALIRACRKEKLFCVISIFVNPTQFGPAEDYRKYPRNLKKDAALAKKAGADLIFTPAAEQIYPTGYRTFVEVTELSGKLCGKYRPGHFRGVATVVLKFFNLIQPDKAYFGWKDAQQLIIIKKMAQDLNLPTEIIGVPTVREPNGLALSSRNVYLSPAEKKSATVLYQTLRQIKNDCEKNGKNLKKTLKKASAQLKKNPLIKLQYLEAVDLSTLENAGERLKPLPKGEILVAVAAFLGSTRLIDNIILHLGNEKISRKSARSGS
jgi:pantoate--beta-alanine ligase